MKKRFYLLIMSALLVLIAVNISLNRVTATEADGATLCANQNLACRSLKVTATGKVKMQPDAAFLNFSVETKDKNLETAQSENVDRIQNLVNALKNQNIPEKDMKTTGFNIYPEYDYMHGQRFTGYKVYNSLRVKIYDIENIGKTINAITKNGANIVSSVEFSIEDTSSAYNAALIKAVDLAKEKALGLSYAIGASDIKIISLDEISNSYYSYGSEISQFAKSVDAAGSNNVIKQGTLEISATIELKYEMIF